uniref:Protein kinase domain-containing protein n=1 Tax=Compsopogon caeruleus TaxID=31354 RepID=A0A7S1XF22_9RHOD
MAVAVLARPRSSSVAMQPTALGSAKPTTTDPGAGVVEGPGFLDEPLDDSLGSFSRRSGESKGVVSSEGSTKRVLERNQSSRDSSGTAGVVKKRRKGSKATLEGGDQAIPKLDRFFPKSTPGTTMSHASSRAPEVDLDEAHLESFQCVNRSTFRVSPSSEVEELLQLRTLIEELKKEALEREAERSRLQERAGTLEMERNNAVKNLHDAQQKAQDISQEVSRLNAHREAFRNEIVKLVRSQGTMERDLLQRKAMELSSRLGYIKIQRTGTSFHEAWEDGAELVEMERRLRSIQELRDQTERLRKELLRYQKLSKCTGPADNLESTSIQPPAPRTVEQIASLVDQDEIYRLRLLNLKREESLVSEEIDKIESERILLAREIRRQRDEKSSRFSDFPLLHDRYVLTKLVGKGGFSEVFKAFDVRQGSWVACKIHQLNTFWTEERKSNYIRHAEREYLIHKSLEHSRVVRLLDVFEIDSNSFCTVLEFCEGEDLDQYLKRHKTLSEREARSILSQVVDGLIYLNEQKYRIIHYDLKPGNLLLTNGEVKITDFGLSKVVETDSTNDGVELTSHGAGTYWYLPPECFDRSESPTKISSKVDVWSVGVILFQMLYGRKPFGNDMSQEIIYRERIIGSAALEFPVKPVVSSEVKELIRLCLTPEQASRPDIRDLAKHRYFQKR